MSFTETVNNKDLLIGFDIGTSSLKLIILKLDDNSIIFELSKSIYSANINDLKNPLFKEQNVDIILTLINELFKQIPISYFNRLKAIQMSGQMHGIVLWNKITNKHSNLVTWQDARCTQEFLNDLPIKSNIDINSGYGCATLFWYAQKQSSILDDFDSAGTIQDYLTYLLSRNHIMSIHNAVSWGFFDLNKNEWQKNLISEYFPYKYLPNVSLPGFKCNNKLYLLDNLTCLEDVDIYVSLGDLQCSVYSCLENDTDCVINISTSSQMCVCIDKSKYELIKDKLTKSITVFPYYKNKVLLVAASLNGGNVLQTFVETLCEWNIELGFLNAFDDRTDIHDNIWSKLLKLAQDYCNTNVDTDLICIPTLFGERHNKNKFASIENIKNNNISIGQLFTSLCKGIIKNLHDMMNIDLLINLFQCKRIIATGNALIKNNILKIELEKQFKQFIILYKTSSDSAAGSAYYLRDLYIN